MEITGRTADIINNWLLEGVGLNRTPFKVGDEVIASQELGIGTGRLEVTETLEVPEKNRHSVGSAQWVRVKNNDLEGMVWDSGRRQWVVLGNESQIERDHPTKFGSNWFRLAN